MIPLQPIALSDLKSKFSTITASPGQTPNCRILSLMKSATNQASNLRYFSSLLPTNN